MFNQMMVYAVRNGDGIYIDDVDRGLKCGCTCPSCGGKLIAKKGEKKLHHFAHESAECSYGLETSLHLMAKEIIAAAKCFTVPPVRLSNQPAHWGDSSPATRVEIERVELEKSVDDIVPDLLLYPKNSSKVLSVEIYVTHKVDENKLSKIIEKKQSTIEIDLSKTDKQISYDDLKNLLLNETENKKWLYNEKVEKYQKKLSRCFDKLEKHSFHRVDYCPIKKRNYYGKPCAEIEKDCWNCDWYAGNEYNDFFDGDEWHCESKHVCLGTLKLKNFEDLKNISEEEIQKFENRKKDIKPLPGFCPNCDEILIKREGKNGTFWGCKNYPMCKYTTNVKPVYIDTKWK